LLWAGLALVVVGAPIAVVSYALTRLDPARFGPALAQAVEQATGRQLHFGGKLRWSLLSLTPTLEADGVSLSNPPGFADPDLLSLDQVSAKIALLPLLGRRVDILDLVLTNPHLVLERNRAGVGDWNLTPPGGAQATDASALSAYAVALEAVNVQGGDVRLKTGNGRDLVLALTSLTGQADSLTAPLNLTGAARLGDLPFTVSGQVGPVARLSGIGAGPWPVNLNFALGTASATLTGHMDQPREAAGYDLRLTASVPALEALAPGLPALHDITLDTVLRDQGSPMPAIDGLALSVGASDLSALRPGLMLSNASVTLAGLDAPLNIALAGSMAGAPLSVQATLGAPGALLPQGWMPADDAMVGGNFPVNLVAQAGGAKVSVAGAIATPSTLAGAALAVNAAVPDLSALSGLAGMALPAWKNIVLQTTVTDPGGNGLYQGIGIDNLTGTMDGAGFDGDATLPYGQSAPKQVALNFVSLDLDKLLAAWPSAQPTPPAAPAPTSLAAPAPTSPAAPAPTSPAAPAPTSTATPAAVTVIPDTPLEFGWAKGLNLQLQLSADQMSLGHQAFTALRAQVNAAGGIVALSPFTGQLPGDAVSAAASLDVRADPAKLALVVNAPALALAPLLTSLHLDANNAQGIVALQVKASSQGDTPHQLAGALAAQVGMASVNATVDGGLIRQIFGAVLDKAGLGYQTQLTAPGPVPVRCAALRLDAANGVATLSGFDFDAAPVTILAAGGANLGTEALNFAISPTPRAVSAEGAQSGPAVVTLTGSFAAPVLAQQAPPSQESGISETPLPSPLAQTGAQGAPLPQAVLPTGSGDDCPAALAMARMGASGPAPEPVSAILPATAPAGQAGTAPTTSGGAGGTPNGAGPANLNSLLGQ
jgi:AsmA protein